MSLARVAGETLSERVRVLSEASPGQGPVLYWMNTAMRCRENQALEYALGAARALGTSLVVFQEFLASGRYASDRHHRFALEGARDVAQQLKQLGIPYACHVERPGHEGDVLRSLLSKTAMVVTEDFPVDPVRTRVRELMENSPVPVVVVDTACVVPMQVIGRPYERAFRFRDRQKLFLSGRLTERPRPLDVSMGPAPEGFSWGFEPVDLSTVDLGALVASCSIDHSVSPVADTHGGESEGYKRWSAFLGSKLGGYDRTRNDPNKHGVSRMSAYLHYGMVSPMKLARDCAKRGGKGAQKYLDELLVWREMAYVWCHYTADPEDTRNLPEWALQSLRNRTHDAKAFDWETLCRSKTGEALWDAAQTSLRNHGELHNNVRMTWGKALVEWTADPGEALRLLVDLNHRYALDGRDPASYGGLLWCLGLFDRPFSPPTPQMGVVRSRPCGSHQARMGFSTYRKHCERPIIHAPPSAMVIGGGLSGAMCARRLQDAGFTVTVLDKGRGPGGRLSTRRSEEGRYDHGTVAFQLSSPKLRRLCHGWASQGVVAPWEGSFGRLDGEGFHEETRSARWWVGTPGMNRVVSHLTEDLEVRFGQRVCRLVKEHGQWVAYSEEGVVLAQADLAMVALPTPQAVELLPDGVAGGLRQVRYAPIWSVMMDTDYRAPQQMWSAARVDDSDLGLIVRESSKPGRLRGGRWVLQATQEWSQRALEWSREDVAEHLAKAATQWLPFGEVRKLTAHRWRYAKVSQSAGVDHLWDPALGLGVCGDGMLGGGVEGALLSADALAGRVVGWLIDNDRTRQRRAVPDLFSHL